MAAPPPDLRLPPSAFINSPFQCLPTSRITTSLLGFIGDRPARMANNRFRCSLSAGKKALNFQSSEISQEPESTPKTDSGLDFEVMMQRFLSFKKQTYLKRLDHFQTLAEVQSPKFMVIACADSRVCPSNILGFQPGDAFMIRNVANIVPPLKCGPTETNAALEFAVNTLQVEHVFITGHSSCAGIQNLMNMQEGNSSFTGKWVVNAKAAKLKVESDAGHLNFEQQCQHCEKESIKHSMLNLLTYPWIEEKVRMGKLNIHGGYYDFHKCTFEKWSLDFKESSVSQGRLGVKDADFWR
ncbi:Beta carbonic anhydrase 5, chloroplastic [Linum grandiflorum]